MRKLILYNLMTLDGYFAGPKGEIDWHQVDEEYNDFALEMLARESVLVFGRVTYEMMAAYWPKEPALKDDPLVAGRMNQAEKIVFSRTLKNAAWSNTRLISQDAAIAMKALKQAGGKDLLILGSANLAGSLAQAGLIDEYHIMLNPVLLGTGRSFFEGIQGLSILKLVETKSFRNGNVFLRYQVGSGA